MALAGKNAQINVTGKPVDFNNEATRSSDSRKVYTIKDKNKSIWDMNSNIKVENSTDGGKNWSKVNENKYILDRLFGKVKFESSRNKNEQIRVSGKYLTITKVAGANEYSYSLEADNQDSTEFGAEFHSRLQGLIDFSGEITRFYQKDKLFYEAINSGEPVVIEFYVDRKAHPDLRGWGIFSGDEDSAAVDGIVEESIEFEGTSDKNKRSVSIG